MPDLPYRLLPPAKRFILHGDSRVRKAAARAWGTEITDEVCRSMATSTRASLWLGPDETLLVALPDETPLMPALEAALEGLPHALVEVSERQVGFEIGGPHVEAILSAGCPLDLHLEFFPIGMCTRTVLAKAEIILWRTEPSTFRLEVWRSFESYTRELLQEFSLEFDATA